MKKTYVFTTHNPNFSTLRYITAVPADPQECRDPSAPSDFHWKILKCRMIIFSNNNIIAAPKMKQDHHETRQIYIIYMDTKDSWNDLNNSLRNYKLVQHGAVRALSAEVFVCCLRYTLSARLAPSWNVIGCDCFIRNRDFLTRRGPQSAVRLTMNSTENKTVLELVPMEMTLIRSDEPEQGNRIHVLPSLNIATVVDLVNKNSLTQFRSFSSYKILKRHWKNIHGYRLPDKENAIYFRIQFWCGEPLTYPNICILPNAPIRKPVPKNKEVMIVNSFMETLDSKFSKVLGVEMKYCLRDSDNAAPSVPDVPGATQQPTDVTQNVSLCTPAPRLGPRPRPGPGLAPVTSFEINQHRRNE